MDIVNGIQDTTVDVVLAGHTHRVSNLMVGQDSGSGRHQRGGQLLGRADDRSRAGCRVGRRGHAHRQELGRGQTGDVKAIVDDANAQTAVLRNQVIGTQQFDIKRAPTRLFESAMGNMVADAMRLKYPGVDAAYTNSGGLRADLNCAPPSAGEQPCEITWGEMFSCCRSATARHPDADGRAAGTGLHQWLLAVLQSCHRYRALPADLGLKGDFRVQRHRPR